MRFFKKNTLNKRFFFQDKGWKMLLYFAFYVRDAMPFHLKNYHFRL